MVEFDVVLKVAVEGGKEREIKSIEFGVDTFTRSFRFEATRALYRLLIAGTRIGAACGSDERTSLPTQIAVILVEGT